MKKIYYLFILVILSMIIIPSNINAVTFPGNVSDMLDEEYQTYLKLTEATQKEFTNINMLANEDGWNLGLILYDSTIDGGKTPLTSYDWIPNTIEEQKVITFQINYSNASVAQDYEAGEVVIKVPALETVFGYEYTITAVVAADRYYDSDKKYEWSYEKEDGYYTFTNNYAIENQTNLEGSIQIAYQTNAQYVRTAERKLCATATLNDELASNTVEINYLPANKTGTLRIVNTKPYYTSKFSNDYIYIAYDYILDESSTEINGFIIDSVYFKADFPEDCLVYDVNMNQLNRNEDGMYHVGYSSVENWLNPGNGRYHKIHGKCIVAFPKSTYSALTYNSTAQGYAAYEEYYDDTVYTEDEVVYITENVNNVVIGDFEFEYSGADISLRQYETSQEIDYNLLQESGVLSLWEFGAQVLWVENATVQIGNDYLIGQNENDELVFLNDDEYEFVSIYIPTLYDYDYNIYSDYNVNIDVYVRYRGETEYVKYGETITKYHKKVGFGVNSGIVGVYLEIKDLPRGLSGSWANSYDYETEINIYKKDLKKGSELHNFCWIRVYDEEGNLVNIPDSSSYSELSKSLSLHEKDLESFGNYVQRAVAKRVVDEAIFWLQIGAYNGTSLKEDIEREEFTFGERNEIYLNAGDYRKFPEEFNGFEAYLVVPKGVELVDIGFEAYRSDSHYSVVKHGDEYFNSADEFETFLNEHMTLEEKYDVDGNGTTLITARFDFSDEPLNFAQWNINDDGNSFWREETVALLRNNYRITYDSYILYGSNYTTRITLYPYLTDASKIYSTTDYNDYNLNGDKTERYYNTYTKNTNIIAAVSTQQDVKTTVETGVTDGAFLSGDVKVNIGEDYTYKLRTRTGINSITNLVIYNNLEVTTNSDVWKGTFNGIDTSFAENQGYTVKTYYSESENAGSLSSDTSWNLYSDSIDKTKVKSLAFEFLDSDGNAAVIPANSLTYVLINMTAIDTVTTSKAYNTCRTEWNALSETGDIVDDIVGITSNTVSLGINIAGILTDYSGTKIWNDNGNEIGVRPSSYTLKLYRNGTYIKTQTFTTNSWSFNDLRVYDDSGNEYVYTVKEDVINLSNGDRYQPTISGTTITNTLVRVLRNITVRHIDQKANIIMKTDRYQGYVNTNQDVSSQNISGYECITTPSQQTVTYTIEDQIINYYYIKQSNVITKYVDENSGKEIATQSTTTYRQDDNYTTEKKTINGYTFTKDSGNTTGTVARENITVTYYYKANSAGVETKFIDQVTGAEIADSVTQTGLEKDSYTTSAKTISGYTLVKTPDNATGQMAVEKTTVTYEYRKNSNVITKYVDENSGSEITTQATATYKEGDSYTTEKKSISGYTYTKDSGNTTGTVARENITVTYYYKKNSAGVETRFIDQVTGDEIADSVTQTGLEKDSYTTTAKTISGYTLVKTPTNATGQMAVEKITVTYEYRKNSNVVVKYIDENYNTELSKITTPYKEGDSYTTEEKSFAGYQLTGTTDNTTGTVARENIEVIYKYKKISAGVETKFIDQVTGAEIANPVVKTGLEKDSYTTASQRVEGYELVKIPDNASGVMTVEKIIVTYEYRKNSNVIAKYLDENTGIEIREDIVTTYKEGDTYTTEELEFAGYELTNKTNNTSGTIARENITVVYKYKKVSAGVETRFIDQVTKQEISSVVNQTGLENDTYTTEPKTIEDYELVKTPENASGIMKVDKITVTYEYRNISYVTAKYIDENTGESIAEDVVVKYLEEDAYTTEEKTFSGYELTNKTNNTSGTIARSDITVEYKYKKISAGVETKFIDQITKEEIATATHQDGLENDEYTTTPKTITGYTLIKTPENATGRMTVDKITVTYEYRLLSTVTTKYIDINTGRSITPDVVATYKEGDIYTTEEKTLAGYQLVDKTDNTTGTMRRENIEVTYQYKKISGGVEVIYVDQANGNPIAASVVKTGLENETYTSEAKEIDGYVLVRTPDNASGKMTVDKIVVRYEYRKLSDVVAKYIDVNYNTEITEEVVQTLKEGDRYTTEEKYFEGYQLVNSTNNKSGIVERKDIEVVYEYKKISAGVETKFIDQVTGEEIATTVYQQGLEKDNYTTSAKEIEGYQLVVTPTNKNGEMTVEKIVVTYEYRLVSTVTTKHIDANTGKEIVEVDVITYKEGDAYTTTAKDLVGYVVTKNPEKPNGTIGRENIEVVYEYKMISDGLVVKYIDQMTNDLLDMEQYTGNENDVIKLEEKTFEKYILSKRPTQTEIKLTVEPQEVRFYYRKVIDITIKGIDSITGEELYSKVQSGVEGDSYTTTPIDMPGYVIVTTPENATGKYTREDTEVIYEYKRGAGGVVVKHIDKDNNVLLEEKLITGYVGEEYETEQNEYEKYDFVMVVGNPKGKLTTDKIEVTYYYGKKTGEVEVVYVDEQGNELLQEKLSGKVDEPYEIVQKEIKNYKLKEIQGNLKGNYTVEKQIIKIVMEKVKGKVVINLFDQDGNLLGQVEESDYIGEIFETELPEKEGYYIDGDRIITVEYVEGEVVINVVYNKIVEDEPQAPSVDEEEKIEPPATGDMNVVLYIVISLASIVILTTKVLKTSKNK